MISINAVYTAVQSALNKENRGLLKPEDFNNLAKISFYNILDSEREDYQHNLENINKGKGDMTTLSRSDLLDMFYKTATISPVNGKYPVPSDLDFIDGLYIDDIQITKASTKEVKLMSNISFMSPTNDTPVYVEYEDGYEVISESITGDIDIYYYRQPIEPRWTYRVIANNIVYDGSNPDKHDVELPKNYFSKYVIDILFYAGLNIRDNEAMKALIENSTSENMRDYRDKILNQ